MWFERVPWGSLQAEVGCWMKRIQSKLLNLRICQDKRVGAALPLASSAPLDLNLFTLVLGKEGLDDMDSTGLPSIAKQNG